LYFIAIAQVTWYCEDIGASCLKIISSVREFLFIAGANRDTRALIRKMPREHEAKAS